MRLTLFLDHQCNLRCSYCYNGRKFAAPMPLDTALDAVDMVLDRYPPLVQVGFFGGEPTLHFPLMKNITTHVRSRTSALPRPVTMVLTTNATLLDDQKLEWLAANKFHLGISIDGCPEAHDACRKDPSGHGSHSQVQNAIAGALRHGLPLKTISVIDPANAEFMGRSFEHLLAAGLRHMSFNVNYEGIWDDGARTRFMNGLIQLTKSYIEAYRKGIDFRLNILDAKIITHVKMGFSCSDRCDFGCQEIAVAPSGRLYPCDRLIGEDDRNDVVIGTVKDGVDIARRDGLIESKNSVLDECRDCDLLPRCMHWCGCVNYAMTGSVGDVSGVLCWFEQAIIDAADKAANTLFAERNPAFLQRYYSFALPEK